MVEKAAREMKKIVHAFPARVAAVDVASIVYIC